MSLSRSWSRSTRLAIATNHQETMSAQFTLDGGYIAAEASIHSNSIYGTGRAELPVLVVSLDFTFRGPRQPGRCYDFRELRCRLSPFDETYVATSLPTHLDVRITSGKELTNQWVQLEVPMDQVRLALINRLRKGGDVSLRFDLELFADELVEVTRTKDPMRPIAWGISDRHHMRSKLTVVIPRSEWLERVLTGTEFAKTHIIELPAIPINSCSDMKVSFDALQQAVKLEGMGFHNEAVAQCRIALEPFFETVQAPSGSGVTKPRRELKVAWQTRLGKRTYDWLNGSLHAVNQATKQSHHQSSSGFDQMEAQMLLMITTALISYAVKNQPTPPASS
jgi:hypothetical protein